MVLGRLLDAPQKRIALEIAERFRRIVVGETDHVPHRLLLGGVDPLHRPDRLAAETARPDYEQISHDHLTKRAARAL